MKKLLLASLVFCGLSASAGMYSSDNYINVQAGLGVSDFNRINLGLESSRFVVSYGMPLSSNGNYIGFTEIGIKLLTVLLSAKYGYEFMRNNNFSFGLDVALLFGIPASSYRSSSFTDLAFGTEGGVFVKVNATDVMSFFIRAGAFHETPLEYLSDLSVAFFVDLGMQYNL